MGLISSLIKITVDTVILPVAVATDIVTVGSLKLTDKATEKLQEDANDLFTGGDGGLI